MLKSETPPQPPPKKNTSLLNFMTWFAPCRFWSLVFLFETKSLRWLSGWKIWKISHTSWLGLMLRCRCFFSGEKIIMAYENHWFPLRPLKKNTLFSEGDTWFGEGLVDQSWVFRVTRATGIDFFCRKNNLSWNPENRNPTNKRHTFCLLISLQVNYWLNPSI